ncbi:putative amino acid tansporter [Trypanosoma theileri]|uniref:Putative amino acid tansporter n=1 Tax=Trypanosoma theileri TaxID=67003 RepID=A0A1X0P7Z8_9TRYP|nr:putative amino acid tansporter [Trypanosoma theileri]ORC93067.1 putative amino acid tansporter [Trypanosoma theileri]
MTSRESGSPLPQGSTTYSALSPDEITAGAGSGVSHSTSIGDLNRLQSESCRVSVHDQNLSVSGSTTPAGNVHHSTRSRQHGGRRSPAFSHGSRELTSPSNMHGLDRWEGTIVEPLTHTSSFSYMKQHTITNYNTNTNAQDEKEIHSYNFLDKKNVGDNNNNSDSLAVAHNDDGNNEYDEEGGGEMNEDMDIHSLGEHLTDVLESSFRSAASMAQRSEPHNTLRRAVFHIFKGNVGAGVFLLPTYYQESGYGIGIIIFLILGVMIIDCALALLHSKQRIDRNDIRTYPAVVEHVLGRSLMHFTKFSLMFTQFGFCVVYIQYASSMFAALFNVANMYQAFVFLSVLLVTPMTFFTHRMGVLAYASMIAAVFVAIVLAGALGEEIDSLKTNGIAAGVFFSIPSMRILLFISGHMFSLEGIGVVLPVENSMSVEDRPKFGKLVKYTHAAIVVLYLIFGLLGYLAFGEALRTSVVLALPSGISKNVLQVLLGLSLIFSYPIQYVPAIQLVDRALGISMQKSREKAYIVRIVLNAFFGALASSIGADTINIFAGFLGAFTGVHLMVTIPAFLAILTERVEEEDRENLTFSKYMKIIFTMPNTITECRWYVYILFAIFIWVGGTYYTFQSVFN